MKLSIAALMLICVGACAQTPSSVAAAHAKSLGLVGHLAPDFHLTDFDHQEFDLASQSGHLVVLIFWATWCPPCRAEMPLVTRLQSEFVPQGIAIVPIAFDEPAKATAFLEKKCPDLHSLVDPDGKVATLYGAHALPTSFLIARDGQVAQVFLSKLDERVLRDAIRDLH
jgi:peroxiredoxin